MPALNRIVTAAAVALSSAALLVTVAVPAPATTLGADNRPITNKAGTTFGVLSHRGGALQWPENSLEAFAGSVAAGFDAIETDILFTRDGQAVMSHYDLLPERCTRSGESIHLLTAAEVAAVRCANLDGKLVVPIPTFDQLAAALAADPSVGLTLDIKSYPGQPSAEQRAYASKAIRLVKSHGLVNRTRMLSFFWTNHLPVIRKYAPKIYVLALDNGTMRLDRVRLADKLGANGYGIKMNYTSEYLAKYIKAKGMDAVPWEVIGAEQRAFSIYYGGKVQQFSTDEPDRTRAELIAGKIDLNPKRVTAVTTLAAPVTISKATYTAKARRYPVVLGKAVPKPDLAQLRSVTLSITVTGGAGTGRLYVGGKGSPLSSSTWVALPAGTATVTVTTPLGDQGRLRIYTTRTVGLTVTAVAYTRVRFG
ncbi:MAG: glycerophosphodiester phosphodiesterase family protein [Propionicimonas sp.]